MAVIDAATAAERWAASAGTAQQRFTEGVQSTTKDPTALAVAQQNKMLANTTAAIQNGRWARGLQRAGKAGWQQATIAKAGNFSTGVSAAKDKYAQAMGPVLAVISQLQTQVNAMPNNNIEDAIQRSATMQRGLHAWKQSR